MEQFWASSNALSFELTLFQISSMNWVFISLLFLVITTNLATSTDFHEFVLFFLFFTAFRFRLVFDCSVLLFVCLFGRTDSSSSLHNPLLNSITHPHVASESETVAANTETPSTPSTNEQTTKQATAQLIKGSTRSSTDHSTKANSGSLTSRTSLMRTLSTRLSNIMEWVSSPSSLEQTTVLSLAWRNGTAWPFPFLSFSFPSQILWALFVLVFLCSFCSSHFLLSCSCFFCRDNVWVFNGNQLHDSNCWDMYGNGCYVWLTHWLESKWPRSFAP